ncbi:MAG TPA: pyrroline-5-carboxylate reductase [Bacilli bacterium]
MNRLLSQKIVFIGAGSMAEAILRGLTGKQKAEPKLIALLNHQNVSRLAELHDQYGVNTASDPETRSEYIRNADILVLAMKPKDAAAALHEISALVNPNQLLISVIAGLSIQTISTILHREMPIVRTMPNTSSTIGLGATGVSFSSGLSEQHQELALEMFTSIGIAVKVEESQMDIVTGISGCGPAYVYYLMESMIAAGVAGGLTNEESRILTKQTVLGAANMMNITDEDPAVLRRKVTSPGGATQAALEILDQFAFSEGIHKAIGRATLRSGEMGAAITEQQKK